MTFLLLLYALALQAPGRSAVQDSAGQKVYVIRDTHKRDIMAIVNNTVTHIATALDHATVLEFNEGVISVEVGNADFTVTHSGKHVVIRPRGDAKPSNLFVWTAWKTGPTGPRFVYELDAPGSVKDMDYVADIPEPRSTGWRKRYGAPESERYAIRDGIDMTVSYSKEGQPCKAVVKAHPPQPPAIFEKIMDEIIPISERGKKLDAMGLTGGHLSGIASMDYEWVHISIGFTGDGAAREATQGNDDLATIQWKGVQCRPEQLTGLPMSRTPRSQGTLAGRVETETKNRGI